jgi:hypothetical protein
VPLAFALLGVAVLVVTSGLKGGTIADAFAGRLNQPLDPAGPPPLPFGVDSGDLTDVPGDLADTLTNTAHGVGTYDGHPVALWIIPILKYARSHGWHGSVTSGFRTFAEQTRIYNSGVRPAAKPGTSNHEGSVFPRGAVDVTDAAQLSNILVHSKYGKVLVWAGAKDPVHFSHPHGGSY